MAPDSGAAPPTGGPALAGLLRNWRARALLTQEGLAERTGLSVRTIRRLEASRIRPRIGSLRLLAQALDLSDAERTLLTVAARGEPPPRPAPAAPVPRQLPADVAGFTGRAADLERLDALLAGDGSATAVVISAIAGSAGVGKTALAVHWAHRVAERFPDGQLYLDLQGFAPSPPVDPPRALGRLLDGLGVPSDQVPVEQEAAAALYRSLLARRRLLVVLDNAREAAQVRPLLPGSPGCPVVITSRERLTGLVATNGARRLTLDVLAPDEAVALLQSVLGADRVAAEPGAAAELAEACAFLPLALRIAAADLIGQPGRPVAEYAAALRAEDRLATLEVDGDPQAAVRAAFDRSYATLAADARRLFRLLGLTPGPEVTVPAAAALAGTTPEQATPLLARLADGHLLEARARGRFGFHDLLRRYARQRSEHEDRLPEREAAIGRLLSWYLHGADAAARLLYPTTFRLPLPPAPGGLPPAGFDRYPDALAWMDAERANLVAAVTHAAEHGPGPLAWLLADTVRGYFLLRRPMVDWLAVARAGLATATRAHDRRAQATARFSLGLAHWSLGRHPQAIEHYRAALELFRETGWLQGQAACLGNLGNVHGDVGEPAQAADYFAQALALDRRAGRRDRQAVALGSLGMLSRELGALARADEYETQALALHRQAGYRTGEAYALGNLGEIEHDLGRLEDALRHLTQALSLYREIGNRSGEAYALYGLAALHRDTGGQRQALQLARAAVALASEISERRAHVEALNTLGSVQLRLGDCQEAIGHHRQALELASQAGSRYPQTGALLGLAAAYHQQGRNDLAIEHAQQALTLASGAGYRVLEGQANAVLAAARQARAGHQATGVARVRPERR